MDTTQQNTIQYNTVQYIIGNDMIDLSINSYSFFPSLFLRLFEIEMENMC